MAVLAKAAGGQVKLGCRKAATRERPERVNSGQNPYAKRPRNSSAYKLPHRYRRDALANLDDATKNFLDDRTAEELISSHKYCQGSADRHGHRDQRRPQARRDLAGLTGTDRDAYRSTARAGEDVTLRFSARIQLQRRQSPARIGVATTVHDAVTSRRSHRVVGRALPCPEARSGSAHRGAAARLLRCPD